MAMHGGYSLSTHIDSNAGETDDEQPQLISTLHQEQALATAIIPSNQRREPSTKPSSEAIQQRVRIKLDTACSRSVSGCPRRLKYVYPQNNPLYQQQIVGFNNTTSGITQAGINEDHKVECYVHNMPKDLCLLCAQEYAAEGAIILFETDGAVLKLNATEILDLRHYISRFPRLKSLHVHDKTYEVIDDERWECPPTQVVKLVLMLMNSYVTESA
jgi:hypothetical protein